MIETDDSDRDKDIQTEMRETDIRETETERQNTDSGNLGVSQVPPKARAASRGF